MHRTPSREDAEAWLTDERRLISAGDWTSPAARRAATLAAQATKLPTFGEYAARWIEERKVKGRPLASRTKDHYQESDNEREYPRHGPVARLP